MCCLKIKTILSFFNFYSISYSFGSFVFEVLCICKDTAFYAILQVLLFVFWFICFTMNEYYQHSQVDFQISKSYILDIWPFDLDVLSLLFIVGFDFI